jgi:hypothetical protein
MRGLTHRYCTLATLLFCVSVAAAHAPASAVDSYPQRPIRLIVPFATGGGAVDAVQAPVSINIGFGIRSRPTTPLIPVKRLAELGVARVTMARMLPSAALMGMHKALELMRDHIETGTVHDRLDLLYGMDEITELMGYSKIADLEAQFLPDDQLERKYGSEKPDYLVRDRKY